MAYTERERRNELPVKQSGMLASNRSTLDRKPEALKFYEFEAAIVIDSILDETHPMLSSKNKTIMPSDYPKNLNGEDPKDTDVDYGWIGCIKFRLLNTDQGVVQDQLRWAMPLENTGVTEIPLVNEVVQIVEYLGNAYYTRKINLNGFINASATYTAEPYYGVPGDVAPNPNDPSYGDAPISKINVSENGSGKLGRTFLYNDRIRSLRRYEGDTIIESRFGSSIRFGAYGSNKATNDGTGGHADYPAGSGNPWVLIRNRQADADPTNEVANHPKSYVTESINNDGSSIQLTSGLTVSDFKTTVKKVILQDGPPEEQPKFSPSGFTSFKYPTLTGDQVVINSDRLVFQARGAEFLQYAKRRFAVATDDEYTVDAHKQIVLTTNGPATINSPLIFLGEANQTGEPALLGRTTTDWMMALCTWLHNTCDWQIELCNDWLAKHEHDTKKDPTLKPTPAWVSKISDHVDAMKKLQSQVDELKNVAPKNMSQRVYLVGGGNASGQPGGELKQ